MADGTLTLNSTWLRNRVAELGLRQWWLAEQVGVDRKTVVRWVNGQVRSIQPANARVLAGVLACRVDELLLAEPARELASTADQRAAGLALASSRLLDRLGPVGEWDVAEQLIKASAVPDLPLYVLGRLYHQLCVACWRQDKFAEAEAHNAAALDLARRCDDRALLADALGSQANLRFWRGEVASAISTWQQALALAPWITPVQRGSLECNLGAALAETGSGDEGRGRLQASLAAFEAGGGTPMQLSITHTHLCMLALRCGDVAAATLHLQRSEAQARRGDYRRGLAFACMLRAEVCARLGDAIAALQALADGRAAFAALGITEALNDCIEGRTLRLIGRPGEALAALQRGLARPVRLPLEEAELLREATLAEQSLAMSPHVSFQAGDLPLT